MAKREKNNAPETVSSPPVKLKKCACGKAPKGLIIEAPNQAKLGAAMGDCCSVWRIEFQNHYTSDHDRTLALAQKAWNDAPR